MVRQSVFSEPELRMQSPVIGSQPIDGFSVGLPLIRLPLATD